jgi:hypothetical protein
MVPIVEVPNIAADNIKEVARAQQKMLHHA